MFCIILIMTKWPDFNPDLWSFLTSPTVIFFLRGESVCPYILLVLIILKFFCVGCFFSTNNSTFYVYSAYGSITNQYRAYLENLPIPLIMLAFTAYLGAHGGNTPQRQKNQHRNPNPDQNRASEVLVCSNPISFNRMEKNLSLTACSLFSSHQSA